MICQEACKTVSLIDSAGELDPKLFSGAHTIGITAGASTPAWIIKEVNNKMSEEMKMETAPEENFADLLEQSIKTLNNGDKVTGTVMQAVCDPSVKAIFNAIGGDDAIRLLPYIDFDQIAANPKIFTGFSDATSIHFMLNADYGALNVLLLKLGIIKEYINWFATWQATFAWECWVGIFVTVPFVTFCVLSGLQSIDAAYYEAAEIDGANFWHKLGNITLPLVRPSLTVATVLNIIYVFNSFPIIWTMSKGAPADKTHTLVTYLYQLAFSNGKSGEAAAVSVIGFIILCICAGVYMVM